MKRNYATRHCTHRHIICQHQIEIEISPPAAEIYFQDERYVDSVNKQIQFYAYIYNAPTKRVKWEVVRPDGTAGAGTINSAGLYRSPPKGSYINGETDIVVVSSVDDPFRKASSVITLVGQGPEPVPEPEIEIFPKVAHLYYNYSNNSIKRNNYIDTSNKVQMFRTIIRNSSLTAVSWSPATMLNGYYYAPSINTTTQVVTVTAYLTGTSASAKAKVILMNYDWPGIVI